MFLLFIWSLFNSLWPNDATWRHRSGSTLAQVMACCLMAPSHYMDQCWLIISEVQWQSHEENLTRDTSATNYWNKLENYLSKISLKSPRGQLVNSLTPGWCGSDFLIVISDYMLHIKFMNSFCGIAQRWMPQNIFEGKSTLVHVMAW